MLDDEQKSVDAPAQAAAPKPEQPIPANGLAVASLVVGLVAFISGWVPFWGLLTGVTAVVLGILALKHAHGKPLAITGIVTGGLAAITGLIFTTVLVTGIISSANYETKTYNTENTENREYNESTN